MERRLAAIVIADVVGYSKLIRDDEEGTLARFQELQHEIFQPRISEHGGRLVKTMGDSYLLEFPSAVAAVECVMQIQREMLDHEADTPDDRRIRFRVGINLGDIVVDSDDIQGDGVNVAARLESLAEPGGILISNSVHEQVRDKIDIAIEDLGEIEVKNIARPVRVFRVLREGEVAKAAPRMTVAKTWTVIAAAIVLVLMIFGGGLWWWQSQPDVTPADPAKMADKLPDKPSIAVLPFANLSNDKDQEYFADGISEDLTTQLSKISSLFVISRTSTFKYKGKKVDIRDIARELGVRYVLEGSVRRAGDQLRINAQLIDATSGGHVWAESYDGPAGDVFVLQDRINRNIVTALRLQLTGDEKARVVDRGTANVAAYEAFQRGERLRVYSKVDIFRKAIVEYERAIALDPDFAAAYAGLGHIIFSSASTAMRFLNQPQSEIWARAQVLADQSIKLGDVPLGHLLQAKISLLRKLDHDRAILHARRAVALDPNFAEGYAMLAEILLYSDQKDEALTSLQQAMRLNPDFPDRYNFLKGQIKFHQGKYQAALEDMATFCKRVAAREYMRACSFYGAAAHAHAGDPAKARIIMKIWPPRSVASFETMIAIQFPFKNPGSREKLIEGIAKALHK